jgi:2-dehydro-3-deoxyphosphogluconate aldolase/(4S)-4-hydroxy-2-oxoglutarate aldolase
VKRDAVPSSEKQRILSMIGEEWLIAILRGDSAEETEEVLHSIVEGGISLVEVPYTTPEAGRVIRRLRERHGDSIVVSAGTVTTVVQAEDAFQAGASAIVSPNLYPPVVEFALSHGLVSMPGCVTPTEVADALRLGADLIKLFPCYAFGPEYLGFLLGPFPGTRIVPAGRITLENMREYRRAGAYAGVVGVTTEMGLLDAVRSRDTDRLVSTARRFIEAARAARPIAPA